MFFNHNCKKKPEIFTFLFSAFNDALSIRIFPPDLLLKISIYFPAVPITYATKAYYYIYFKLIK